MGNCLETETVCGIRFHLETRGLVSGGLWPVHRALVHSTLLVRVAFSFLCENESWEDAEALVKGGTKELSFPILELVFFLRLSIAMSLLLTDVTSFTPPPTDS